MRAVGQRARQTPFRLADPPAWGAYGHLLADAPTGRIILVETHRMVR